jgi:hypothetical protein
MRLASNGEIVAAKKSPVQSSVSLNRGSRNLASQLSWQKEVFFRKKRKGQSVFLLLGMAIALFVKLNKAQGRSSQLFSAHKSLEYHFAKLSLFARIAHFLKFFSTVNITTRTVQPPLWKPVCLENRFPGSKLPISEPGRLE